MMRFERILIVGLLAFGSCRQVEPPESLRMTATIKDIMDSMIDPSGDFMFEAVAEIADEQGIRQKAPRTDEEWREVRHHAFILMEGMNLLVMEGRQVAPAGFRTEFPVVELQPDEIQKLVNDDRPSFIRRAKKLQDAAAMALTAADRKDVPALFKAIEAIDAGCESCHVHYWYPKDAKAVEDAKQKGIY
jgi:hypothetical protein